MAHMHSHLHACLSNMLISIVLHGVIVGVLRVRVIRDQEGDPLKVQVYLRIRAGIPRLQFYISESRDTELNVDSAMEAFECLSS